MVLKSTCGCWPAMRSATATPPLRLVREHGPADHVADRPHARRSGAAVVVDGDEAAVELEACAFGVQAFRVREAADRTMSLSNVALWALPSASV